MPVVRPVEVNFAAGETRIIELSPYDRFGARGGKVTVGGTSSATSDMTMQVLVGSDQLTTGFVLPVETNTGLGPTTETPTVSGFGAPSDPITVRVTNTGTTTTTDVIMQINVENA